MPNCRDVSKTSFLIDVTTVVIIIGGSLQNSQYISHITSFCKMYRGKAEKCKQHTHMAVFRPLIQHMRCIKIYVNPLKTKRRPLYVRLSPYRAVKSFHLGYKNQSSYAVSGTSADRFI
jgi:hypothetical protein